MIMSPLKAPVVIGKSSMTFASLILIVSLTSLNIIPSSAFISPHCNNNIRTFHKLGKISTVQQIHDDGILKSRQEHLSQLNYLSKKECENDQVVPESFKIDKLGLWRRRCQSSIVAIMTAGVLSTNSMMLPSRNINHDVKSFSSTNVNVKSNMNLEQQPQKSNFLSILMEAANANEIETFNNDENNNVNKSPEAVMTTTSSSVQTVASAQQEQQPLSPYTTKRLSAKTNLERSTVLDEVWTLVDKYYLDRSFHDQDWSNIRSKYESRLPVNPSDGSYDDEEAMKLATSMVSSLGDKYSRILDKAAYSRIQKFDLIGVGATLMPSPEDKRIMVGAPPVDGSEAQKGGIKYGDYIVAVNGVPTKGRTAFEIIDQISEDPNAQSVTMTVLTEGPDDLKGEGNVRDVTMKRQTMEVKNPVSYKITERRKDGTVVGYVRLSEFNSLVEAKLKEALIELRKEGANAYVLDMRSNPGGAFQSAVEISSLFMEDKIATTVVDSNAVEMPFKTSRGKVMIDDSNPLVIWIDGGSASATEVLAGALHDQCRASIMGSHSFGKGLIQAVYGLRNGSGLVLTVAKYVTPNGTDIQGSGITVDLESKLPFLYLPKVSSDTTKVDFNLMNSQNKMCVPQSDISMR